MNSFIYHRAKQMYESHDITQCKLAYNALLKELDEVEKQSDNCPQKFMKNMATIDNIHDQLDAINDLITGKEAQ